ncbi:hypothetical protein [Parapedobacter koreensis]|uniref:Uncharacterized protein n=1 Tax=Parapedobacter koreensis TaxID=332977 RepID=A0A1H7HW21_9SPHI|nr:hypothetical protein [Parapedobacter koreensis]SEK54334.1 hypothetical protein SAMN05421740_10232 [Parapedobacter koreensis]
MKSTTLVLLFFTCSCSLLWAQNEYPTAKNEYIKIDGGGLNLMRPVTTGGWARGMHFYNGNLDTHYMGMGLHGSGDNLYRFYIAYGQSPWTSNLGLYILPNGNTGIGTNNPEAKLAVNGNILAKEVKVKTDISVPDYVFEPDYDLPELSEIAAYVKEHKHLPEIPSAKDIEKGGLDLAEMNLLLLKKVEELTLYLMEKDKKEKHMEADIQELKTELAAYIEANGHLPRIPPAIETEKERIELGDMSGRLLEKIEELTRYIIDQHKRISEMDERIKQLEKSEPKS